MNVETPKVKRSYHWKADYLTRKVQETQKVLAQLTDSVIADLVRRGQESNQPDGYGSGGDGSGVRSSGGDSSTERAALHGLPDPDPDASGNAPKKDDWEQRQHERDFIREALDALFSSIVEMSGHAAMIEKKRHVAVDAGDRLKNRGYTQCHACHRDVECTTADPIRAGYCDACRKAFERWKASFDGEDMATARRFFEAQRPRFEGHTTACERCAYEAELTKPAHAV